jgi:hypothetical protein
MQRLFSDVRSKKIDMQQATPVEKKKVAMTLPTDSRDLAFTGPGCSFFLHSLLACFDSGV